MTYSNPLRFIIFLSLFLFFCFGCGFIRKQKRLNDSDTSAHELEVNGMFRSFYVHVGKNQIGNETEPTNGRPLLLVLHGRLGSGLQVMEQSQFNVSADKESLIVVYPDGYSRSWADGRGQTPADKENIDDVFFLEKTVLYMEDKYKIDSSKVFIVGHSNGGFMVQRMAVEKPHLFKGAVSIAAQLSKEVVKKWAPSSGLSVAFMSGTEDPTVPYYGGYVRDGGEILSVEDSIDRWKTWNGCSGQATVTKKDEKSDETSLEIFTYSECKNNTVVRLYKVIGGGHSWPGRKQSLPVIFRGKLTEELDATLEAWNFFKGL
ncbi:alpha/beta hydrolase family esterase [Leptospira ilyithenensis]|uniref:Alpha/beta hydrolase n=1 Tax=Leptospira ilyithenensis TaxID=2484901 RepID=A0A4R9LLP5_9LEPT|nr:prolyl oligopeptidase family serine peptidase [Leptospira ilyithenensis]TGN06910.1 alpha/beta hydrolase [Leptospira ilyithenensis]